MDKEKQEENIIEIKNLVKKYKMFDRKKDRLIETIFPKVERHKSFTAMNNLNLTVKKGEVLGILGRNGAGKSTLLKMITGVVVPTSGTLSIKGKISSLLELGTAFNSELTGEENIYQHGQVMGLSKEEIEATKNDVIEFADIGEHLYQPVKTYSSGMFARLAFACAINVNPDILIVDEILSVGDIEFQKKCMDKFKEFKDSGKTILYVSHGLDTIQSYCERAIWLEKGKIKEIGSAIEVVENYYRSLIELNNTESKTCFVKLNEVTICENKNKFDYSDAITLDIAYEVLNEEINTPGITVELRRAYARPCEFRHMDQFICSVNSNADDFLIPWKLGINHIKLMFDNLRLKDGTYYVDILFCESQNLVTLESIENTISFTVSNKRKSNGFIFLKEEWRV